MSSAPAQSRLRIAMTPLSGLIKAGRVNKAGTEFIGDPEDVTSDVLRAVQDFCPIGTQRLIFRDGQAVFRLLVLPPDAPSRSQNEKLDQVLLELKGRGEPVLSSDPLWSPALALAREMRLELEGLKERQRLLKQASDESLARHLDDANRFPAAQRP